MEVHVLTQDVLVACIMMGLTAVVGCLGNLLMLRALILYRSLRSDFFILLGSVAIADIMCLAVAVPRHIFYLTWATDPITDAWCKTSKYLEVATGFVAAYHLVVLAVLRGILLTSRGLNPPTPVQTLVAVSALWVIAFLTSIPFFFTTEEVGGYCHYTVDTDIKKDVWLINSFTCFVPLGLIFTIYVLAHMMGKRYFQDSYTPREKQMSKLVTVIVGVFLVCQLPFRVLDLHVLAEEINQTTFEDGEALESLYIARNYLMCLMMADKAIRPVIYSKLAPKLSEAFDEVINCTVCSRFYEGRSFLLRGGGQNGEGAAGGDDDEERGGGGGCLSSKANGHAARLPSTSSNAPLTGGMDTGSDSAPEPDALPNGKPDIMEIVPLEA